MSCSSSRSSQASASGATDAYQTIKGLAAAERERDVLLPLVCGYTNRQVAEQLEISVKTVDLYRSRVMKRMQAETLADLVGMAIAAGLVDALRLREAAPT